MTILQSLFIIKPEAFNIRTEIKKYIVNHSQLEIINSKVVKLTKEDIEKIYGDDINTDLLEAVQKHMQDKLIEVCVVEGEDAIESLIDIVGKNFNSEECGGETARYVFGRLGVVNYGKFHYYLNAIHKASPSEALAALEWFYQK